ncbi:MAG: ABC transporter permease [Pseudomonadales bacterium]|nr:ABC transporter permease [Pseudomonadales bacterium]
MLWSSLLLAWRELRANLLRSLLTTLGIIVGVAAVVIIVTLGQGVSLRITDDIASMGRNMLFVAPFKPQRSGPAAPQTPFRLDDAEAIARDVRGVLATAPTVQRQMRASNGQNHWNATVTGTTPEFLDIREWALAAGRAFNTAELRSGRPVCILGVTPRRELFGPLPAVGAKIRLQTTTCEVIGELAAKGQNAAGQDQDDVILMPIQAAQRRLLGSDDVHMILVSAVTAEQVPIVQESIRTLLRERRRVRAEDEDNFTIQNLESIMSLVQSTTGLLTAGLSAIAAISLLVGGIGIMNIMLVSVTERTREIGIRLAIGALEREVLAQFLIEALLLSCFGGLIGALLGLGIAAVATAQFDVPFVLSPSVVLVAFGFSAAVGVVFGIMPARRAARMDPIEALRHE